MIAEAVWEIVGGRSRSASLHDDAGWTRIGAQRTSTGEIIDEARAQTFSAVWCATRIISEGVASLPCNLREHVNERETKTASGHPLQRIIHDSPNPEQDSFQFFDMQVPLQVNSGNAYAEIQRERDGSVSALWPIHPSRIPERNIVRGPVRARGGISVGGDGEIIYLVRNNDGTTSPIPARDMLHVPGVMSGNGLTGKGITIWAAETLGIIGATEAHVGAFYRNGATPDIVIKIPSSVSKEERENLRNSWQSRQGGTANAHKALILIGESDAKPLGVDPEASQLIDGRKFGIAEVSRFWRVPLHMLSEMSGAKYDNVEVLNIQFLQDTLIPWLIRWEKAMKRQLLTPAERERYSFKFDVKGRLRGDTRTRFEGYERLHGIGVLSPDDIRELEDMNPLPGGIGKRYFIKANNLVPLDRIDEIATFQQQYGEDEPDDDPSGNEAARSLLKVAMRGLIGYEARSAVRAAAKPETFQKWLDGFYPGKFQQPFIDGVSAIAPMLGRNAMELYEEHASRSVAELSACMDVPVSEFAAKVQATVDSWSTRYSDED